MHYNLSIIERWYEEKYITNNVRISQRIINTIIVQLNLQIIYRI